MQRKILALFCLCLTLTLILSTVPFAFAGEIFADGFESGDFTAWTTTSGSPTVVSTTKHTGEYGLFANADGEYASKTFAGASTVYLRWYQYLDSYDDNTYIAYVRSTDNDNIAAFEVLWNGKIVLSYLSGIDWLTDTSDTTVSSDTWHYIEIETVIDDANGVFKVYLDGVEVSDVTQTGVDNNRWGNVGEVRLGTPLLGGAANVYIDCAVISDSYIGEETEETVYSLDLTATAPKNITYDATIPVSLSVSGNDTNPVYSWNVQFTNSSWLYGSNKTSTNYTMEIYENQEDCLFACTVTGDNSAYDYVEVYFSVEYDAWDPDLNNYFCAAILLVMGFVFMVFMVSRRFG